MATAGSLGIPRYDSHENCCFPWEDPGPELINGSLDHRCKKNFFYVFFNFGHIFTFFFKGFLFLKTLAKFRAASRLTRSTFKITATKQTYDFSVACRWHEMPPYKLLHTCYVWRIVWRPWRPFLGHQAWSWTTLRRGNVFYYVYKLFYFCHVFTFLNFYLNVFHIRVRSRPP